MHIDVLREPDMIFVRTEDEWKSLTPSAKGWTDGKSLKVTIKPADGTLKIALESVDLPIRTVKAWWKADIDKKILVLGDAWERGYGDLEWRGIIPERILPWYFLISDGATTRGYGVKTAPRAFCHWQLDLDGVTFTADVRSGNVGVILGAKRLEIATICTYEGGEGESAISAARNFCAIMCEKPVLPAYPVYGGNNWYYAYGKNVSHTKILEDSKFMSSLSSSENRPFMVIDDGWQLNGMASPWTGNSAFPDMEALAGEMKEIGVRPGIWCRVLTACESTPESWIRHQADGLSYLDPSIPDVISYVREIIARMARWGYDLVKHDFSTYDIMNRWGFGMKSNVNRVNQPFQDRSRTTAEVILDLYRAIAEAAGDMLVIGCNTVSHLAAGLFAIQRTGDDTSGHEWERTRYMGINTLAFRMPQQGTFYSHDADCVGLTQRIPWELNKQWLDLLARSGTPLFVSADPAQVTKENIAAIEAAFDTASKPQAPGEPLDWFDTTCPARWLLNGEEVRYKWNLKSTAVLSQAERHHWWI